MSEIASAAQLTQIHAQPPLSWYFDPKVLAAEQRVLFEQGPGYVGHALLVPNLGDYHVLDWMDNAKMLVRNEHGVELLSNICRHRQATCWKGAVAQKISCVRCTAGLTGWMADKWAPRISRTTLV